jgi:hypothetical protein
VLGEVVKGPAILPAEFLENTLGALQRQARPRTLHSVGLAASGVLRQELGAVEGGKLLDSLSGWVDWQQEESGFWKAKLTYERQRPRDETLLRRFDEARIMVRWCTTERTEVIDRDAFLGLQSHDRLVSTPIWLPISSPTVVKEITALPQDRLE